MDVICPVCHHHCHLKEGGTGFCKARTCENGISVPLNYGKLTSLALDPIEKKPLKRFCPGEDILSVGSFGCSLACPYCQNYEISRSDGTDLPLRDLSPEYLTAIAWELFEEGRSIGVAFTYNEPMISYEYLRDAAKLIHARGMKNVVVTSGAVTTEVLAEVLPYIDAFNIDLKAFTEDFYRMIQGDLTETKDFIRMAAASSHVEVTTLVIPGENDSEDEMRALSSWLASVDPDITLHVTRYFPRYRYRKPPTPVPLVYRLADVARENLAHVYVGNC